MCGCGCGKEGTVSLFLPSPHRGTHTQTLSLVSWSSFVTKIIMRYCAHVPRACVRRARAVAAQDMVAHACMYAQTCGPCVSRPLRLPHSTAQEGPQILPLRPAPRAPSSCQMYHGVLRGRGRKGVRRLDVGRKLELRTAAEGQRAHPRTWRCCTSCQSGPGAAPAHGSSQRKRRRQRGAGGPGTSFLSKPKLEQRPFCSPT